MSLRDLPENWQDMPLDDEQRMVDVLDLFVSNRARYDGSLFFLVCDEGSRVRAPIQIDEVTRSPLPDSDEMLENLVMAITNVGLELRALVAIARPGPLRVRPSDESWAQLIRRACGDRVPLMGIHLLTPQGSLPIPEPCAATAPQVGSRV